VPGSALEAGVGLVRMVLKRQCAYKNVPVQTLQAVIAAEKTAELRNDWQAMLAHQLPVLPPIDEFLDTLEGVFDWQLVTVLRPHRSAARSTAGGDWVFATGCGTPMSQRDVQRRALGRASLRREPRQRGVTEEAGSRAVVRPCT
jgi:hypothetical protein